MKDCEASNLECMVTHVTDAKLPVIEKSLTGVKGKGWHPNALLASEEE